MKGLRYVVAWAAMLSTTAATPAHSVVRKETVMPHNHDGENRRVAFEITGAAHLKQDPLGNATDPLGNATAAAGDGTSPDAVAAGLTNDSAITITTVTDSSATTGSVVTGETPLSVDPGAGLTPDELALKAMLAKGEISASNASEAAKSTEEKANEEVLSDDLKKEVGGLPLTSTALGTDPGEPIPMHLERPDLTFDYVDVSTLGTCDSHYEFQGAISNDECAQRCYETHGCTKFSNGGCSLGCRVSAAGKNVRNGVDVPLDGQCTIDSGTASSGCIVYELAFFNAVKQPSSCDADFKLITSATTKAECAHACKNTAGCTSFSAEPNCMGGCRISEPAVNANRQCSLSSSTGCTQYKVFR